MTDSRALNNILHLLSPLHGAYVPADVRGDYVIETEIGCFKLAYSKETHCMALFYARHPDVLAACEDETGSYGIAHKDHLLLVKLFKINHDQGAKWDLQDDRNQFEVDWARRDISAFAHDVPRIFMREGNLHRTDEHTQSSAYIVYKEKPSPDVEGESSFDITTKTNKNFRLAAVETEYSSSEALPENTKNLLIRLFRIAGHFINHRTNHRFALQTTNEATQEKSISFRTEDLADVTIADHAGRIKLIEQGMDPVGWGESKFFPLYRAKDRLHQKLAGIADITRENPEELIRHMGTQAIHLLLDGFGSVFLSAFIDKMSDFALKDQRAQLPPEWQKIIRKGSRRLVTVNSALHGKFIYPDPNEFGDFRWVNPHQDLCNFLTKNHPLLPIDPVRTASNWIKSHFHSPYASALEYRGENYRLLPPAEWGETKIMPIQTSHGIMLYYVHKTQMLYAYYNQSDYETPYRNLPADACSYLQAGTVLKFDLKDRQSLMSPIPFDEFQNEIRRLSNRPDLTFPSADTPKKDMMNKTSETPTLPIGIGGTTLPTHDGLQSGVGG